MSYKAENTSLINALSPVEEIKEAIDSFEQNYWLSKHSSKEDLVLFHYTNAVGMKGIINNRSFWSTDAYFLNDNIELKYGIKIILEKLKFYLNKENDESIIFLLNKLIEVTGVQNTYDTYITCFSEDDNLLNQWEKYAAQGKGYNLGIHFSSDYDSRTKTSHYLDNLSTNYYPVLRKVFYEIDEQYEIVDNYINTIIDGAKKALKRKNELYKYWGAPASLYAANILLEIIFSLKSPSYKDEKEWRLVYMIDKSWKQEIRNYKINENMIVPYLNTYLYENLNGNYIFPLHTINIGPMLPKETTNKSLENYLANIYSCSQHPIKISKEIKIGCGT